MRTLLLRAAVILLLAHVASAQTARSIGEANSVNDYAGRYKFARVDLDTLGTRVASEINVQNHFNLASGFQLRMVDGANNISTSSGQPLNLMGYNGVLLRNVTNTVARIGTSSAANAPSRIYGKLGLNLDPTLAMLEATIDAIASEGIRIKGIASQTALYVAIVDSANAQVFAITATKNFLFGPATVGAAGQYVLSLAPGTAPAAVADMVQLYSRDAGSAYYTPAWVDESGQVMAVVGNLAVAATPSTGVGSVKMNNANAATNAGFIQVVTRNGTLVWVPYWADDTP